MGGLAVLSPFFLYGALGASIPLLLHLIKRERAKPRVFSTLRFLKMSSRQVVRRQRLRRLLLLLLRMACCALLAVIFARPFLKESAGAAFMGPRPKAVALVIDTSYSMGFGTRLDRVKRRAREIIEGLHPGDQVVLMTFSTQGQMIKELSSDTADLESLIRHRIVRTNQGTHYIEALRMANDQLGRSGFSDRTIYLFSDFQKIGWNRHASGWKLSPGIMLKAIDVWDDRDANIAVTDVNIPGVLTRKKRNLEIAVRLKNFGLTPYQGQVRLTVNGRPAGKKRVSLPSQSGRVVTLRHTFRRDRNTAMITFGEDPLPIDNRLYFTLDTPSPLRVLLVEEGSTRGKKSSAGYYLGQAMALRTDPPMTVDIRAASRLGKSALGRYEAIVLADLTTLDRAARSRLTGYVRSGGGLLIGLGAGVSPNVFNTAFGALLPARLRDVWPEKYSRDRFRSMAEVDYAHPIFRPFSGPHHGDFGTARFFQTGRVRADSSAAVLAKFEDGSPALLEKALGRGRVLLFTSTFNTAWNDLPIRGVYVPFLYQAIDYLGGRQGGGRARRARRYHLVGEAVRLDNPSIATVTKPSGTRVAIKGTSAEALLYTGTDEPGLYALGPNGRYGHFAVNPDTRESDFTRLDVEEFVAAVINPVTESREAQEMKSQANLAQDTEIERRQRLWWYLSVLLLALVLGETLLANRTHR